MTDEILKHFDEEQRSNENWIAQIYGNASVCNPRQHAVIRNVNVGEWQEFDSEPKLPSYEIIEPMTPHRFDLIRNYQPELTLKTVDKLVEHFEEGIVTSEEIAAILRKHHNFPGRGKLEHVLSEVHAAEAEKRRLARERQRAEELLKLEQAEELQKQRRKFKAEVIKNLDSAIEAVESKLEKVLQTLENKIVLPEPKTWRDDVKGIGKKVWKVMND